MVLVEGVLLVTTVRIDIREQWQEGARGIAVYAYAKPRALSMAGMHEDREVGGIGGGRKRRIGGLEGSRIEGREIHELQYNSTYMLIRVFNCITSSYVPGEN